MFLKNNSHRLFLKSGLDKIAAVVLLFLLLPLLASVAMLIRVKLGTPVLFSQVRPGRDERPFRLFKFRTMTDARDNQGNLLPDHVRLTPLGKFLRRTSIDELPELLNVIKGDMSLVGPRPLLMEYLPYYTATEMRRHEVKPGITGWAQINGRNYLPWNQRLALDVWYVDHWTIFLDLRILLQTIVKVLRRDGVAVDPDMAETNLREERSELQAPTTSPESCSWQVDS